MLKHLINQNNQVNRKHLHKVKKNWVVISTITVALLGGSAAAITQQPVHAVTTQTTNTTTVGDWKPNYASGKADNPNQSYVLTPGYTFIDYQTGNAVYYKFGSESGVSFPSNFDMSDLASTPVETIHFRHYSDINNPNAQDITTQTVKSNETLFRYVSYSYKTNSVNGTFGAFALGQTDGSGLTKDGSTYTFSPLDLTDLSKFGLGNYTSPVNSSDQSISSITVGPQEVSKYDQALSPEKYGTYAAGHKTTKNDAYVYVRDATTSVTDTKTVTRNINLVDADNNNSSLGTVPQTVTYTRSGTKDLATGETTWNNWTAKDGKTGFDAYTAPDKSADGYVNPENPNVAAQTVDPDTATDGETFPTVPLKYTHKKTNVTAKTDGISQDAKNQLTRSLERTIHFVDSKGNVIKDPITQKATFNGTAEYDWVTKTLVDSNNITWDNGDKTDDPYTAPSTVEKDGVTYTNPDNTSAIDLDVNTNPSDVTVTYKGSQSPVTPKNPQGHLDDIRKTVTRTIHFVDQNGHKIQDDKVETVIFERTGYLDENGNFVATSNWSADGAGTFDKVNDSIDGYTVKDDSQNKTVKANETDQNSEITISYEKNSTPAPTPAPNNNGGNGGNNTNGGNSTNGGTNNNATNNGNNPFATPASKMHNEHGLNALPSTAKTNKQAISLAAVLSVVSAALSLFFTRSKKEEQE